MVVARPYGFKIDFVRNRIFESAAWYFVIFAVIKNSFTRKKKFIFEAWFLYQLQFQIPTAWRQISVLSLAWKLSYYYKNPSQLNMKAEIIGVSNLHVTLSEKSISKQNSNTLGPVSTTRKSYVSKPKVENFAKKNLPDLIESSYLWKYWAFRLC